MWLLGLGPGGVPSLELSLGRLIPALEETDCASLRTIALLVKKKGFFFFFFPFVSPSCGPSPELKGVGLVAVLSDFSGFDVIMSFGQDRPSAGSHHTDHGIKSWPM